ncbi:hypothetical protein FHT44_005159 [Mycolicibacterium sp. BK634]|uniref:hypothetical protein n=1 Tax=Mycolicibacterium sp. BK634 TaxID=2587099 RepID=UPI00160D850C|nr:hypothetical protein [Mycolicibacterium sp. BK634]MBB3752647.1 hypothetical protein [Mycolicibacterium sp. BK634]
MRRWYSPAYRTEIGPYGYLIHPLGSETVILEHADREAAAYRAQQTPDEPQIFVAFRDIPEWQELNDFERKRAEDLM